MDWSALVAIGNLHPLGQMELGALVYCVVRLLELLDAIAAVQL